MAPEPRQHLEIVAPDMGNHAGTGIPGEVKTSNCRLFEPRAVIAARRVAEVMVVEFDLRAMAELVFKVLGQASCVIGVGLQWRADKINLAHGDTSLPQAEADRSARQFPA